MPRGVPCKDPAHIRSAQGECKNCRSENRFRLQRLAFEILVGPFPRCSCSGCPEYASGFNTLDHILCDGAAERRRLSPNGSWNGRSAGGGSVEQYRWIIAHPDEARKRFTVLCSNCNLRKHIQGVCPHVAENMQGRFFLDIGKKVWELREQPERVMQILKEMKWEHQQPAQQQQPAA